MRVKILYNPHTETVKCTYRGTSYELQPKSYIKLLTEFDEEAARYWQERIHHFLVIKTVNLDAEKTEQSEEQEEVEPEATATSGYASVSPDIEEDSSEENDEVDETMKRDALDGIATALGLNPNDYINKKELVNAIKEKQNG